MKDGKTDDRITKLKRNKIVKPYWKFSTVRGQPQCNERRKNPQKHMN